MPALPQDFTVGTEKGGEAAPGPQWYRPGEGE